MLIPLKKSLHIFFLLFLLFFSLTGTRILEGLNYESSRTFDTLWNFGHLLLFFYYNYLLIHLRPGFKNKSWLMRVFIVFGLTTLFGFGIEIFQQSLMGGKADLSDIAKNYLGALLAFIIFWTNKKEKWLKGSLYLVLSVLLVIEIKPVVATISDEIESYKQFPVLADFESDIELERLSTTTNPLEISDDYSSHGEHSLKVEFIPRNYSTLSLNYFPRDWQGYSFIKFDIYNPGEELTIICRINDREHREHGNVYQDRFNKEIILISGWNNIQIDLAIVRNAPATRRMNLKNVLNWAIFTVKLPEKRIVFLDYIRLE